MTFAYVIELKDKIAAALEMKGCAPICNLVFCH